MTRDLREYRVWRAMHDRCYSPNVKSYKDYGARGIVIADCWHGRHGFHQFMRDMGARPKGSTLDRINNNGPYSPDNCRWATRDQQANNKRNNRNITANGKTLTLAQWAKELNCSPAAITRRIKAGMPPENAVTIAVQERPNAKLTVSDVQFIKQNYPMLTATALARQFKVSKKTVLNVLHGKTFKDVEV